MHLYPLFIFGILTSWYGVGSHWVDQELSLWCPLPVSLLQN